jgi:hypothetical protein
MTTMSSTVMQLILELLSDEDELAAYESNKEGFLFDRGAGGCAAEIDDAVNMYKDYSPAKAATAKRDGEEDEGVKAAHKESDDKGGDRHYGGDDKYYGGDVTNHYVTNNSTHNDNGDKYDINAEDGQVALNGGINLGEEAEIEGDLNYEPEGSFNENGSGVQINGEDASIGGDLNSAGGSGSSVSTDYSTDLTVGDVNVQTGDNNQNESDQAINDSEEAATSGGTVLDVEIEDNVVVADNDENKFELGD